MPTRKKKRASHPYPVDPRIEAMLTRSRMVPPLSHAEMHQFKLETAILLKLEEQVRELIKIEDAQIYGSRSADVVSRRIRAKDDVIYRIRYNFELLDKARRPRFDEKAER